MLKTMISISNSHLCTMGSSNCSWEFSVSTASNAHITRTHVLFLTFLECVESDDRGEVAYETIIFFFSFRRLMMLCGKKRKELE